MRIGLDIDNVITDFDKCLEKEYKEEDKRKRNSGIINKNARHVALQYDWTEEERIDFFAKNMERLALELEPRENAKKYIDLLLAEGHEIYLLTNRVFPDYKEPEKTTIAWLSKHHINYTKLVFTKTTDKSQDCIKNGIDIMFDDDTGNCIKLKKAGINFCMVCTRLNYNHWGDLPYVRNWQELYHKIKDMVEIKNVILDNDMGNEVDDQFALTYLLNSLDKINLEAITIAPFSKSGYASTKTIVEGTEVSYQLTMKILDLMHKEEYKKQVYKGAISYLKDSHATNEAVDQIIKICLKNEKTTILAIGAITNVALAIIKEPKIKDKIEVIWLGGNSFLANQNREFNFIQDIEAVREVFTSGIKLTVIPCKNVASNLTTTTYELSHYLKTTKLGKFLIQGFVNCKKSYYKTKEDSIGSSKTLWDLSVIAYAINSNWFVKEYVSCPLILEDGRYEQTTGKHEITFIHNLSRNKIYHDYFIKMMKNKELK